MGLITANQNSSLEVVKETISPQHILQNHSLHMEVVFQVDVLMLGIYLQQ